MESTVGLPKVVLADVSPTAKAMAQLEAAGVEPLVAIAKTQPHRPYDFRPPPAEPKPPRRILEPWRLEMKAKLDTDAGKARYKKRKQTIEPVFGIIKSAVGFTRFHLRGIQNVATEWVWPADRPMCSSLPHRPDGSASPPGAEDD